jgi:alpha-mannosidase
VDYAVLLHDGDAADARLVQAADDFLVPLERVRGGRPGAPRAATGQALAVDGAPVSAVLRTDDGELVVRVYNPTPEPVSVRVRTGGDPATGHVVDLAGNVLLPFDESVALRAFEIVTLRLA